VLRAFEGRWREALAFVSAHWPAVQAVGDALWKRRSLTGDEVGEILEQVEARTREIPSGLTEGFETVLRERGEARG
jgi:hypothetical protein